MTLASIIGQFFFVIKVLGQCPLVLHEILKRFPPSGILFLHITIGHLRIKRIFYGENKDFQFFTYIYSAGIERFIFEAVGLITARTITDNRPVPELRKRV